VAGAGLCAGGPWQGDNRVPPMTRRLHEGKYELDSLAAVLKHFNSYYEWTGDSTCFRPDWIDAIKLILDTITDQQISTRHHNRPMYRSLSLSLCLSV
jgi:meiotically up-regulated gene 157 (Mug157) protein